MLEMRMKAVTGQIGHHSTCKQLQVHLKRNKEDQEECLITFFSKSEFDAWNYKEKLYPPGNFNQLLCRVTRQARGINPECPNFI